MQHLHEPIGPETTLAELAATHAGASRVFHRHGLDFCCQGRVTLAEACARKHLDPAGIARAIEDEALRTLDFRRFDEAPLPALVEHVLERFHAAHRAELPRLLEMARKVEAVHGGKPECPRGLHAHLEHIAEELESHMQKEEQILFPLILSGRGRMAAAPIQVMEEEHVDHGRNLERLRELAHGYVLPADACGTWSALYLGLQELEHELMQHIHLENHLLFPRALRS